MSIIKNRQYMLRMLFWAALTLQLMCILGSKTYAADEVKVYINNDLLDFSKLGDKPQIYEGRTYVPIRTVAEALGFKLEWNGEKQEFTMTKYGDKIVHKVLSNELTVNGQKISYDYSSINVNYRTLMPIRMLGEAVGGAVSWVPEDKAVIITVAEHNYSEAEIQMFEAKEELTKKLVGTYIGVDGSVLCLHEYGDADYYWIGDSEVTTGNVWGYQNGILTIYIPTIDGYNVNVTGTAAITGNNSSFVLINDNIFWSSEKFIKQSGQIIEPYQKYYREAISMTLNSQNYNELVKNIDQNRLSTKIEKAVTPDFKHKMDNYEKFFDSYVSLTRSQHAKLGALPKTYSDYDKKYDLYLSEIEGLNRSAMTVADSLYYAKICENIKEKLSSV